MMIVVPSVIVLVGPSGSGKSTWARRHFDEGEIVSSDRLRAAVGLDEYDQRASGDAFAVLHEIVRRRIDRRLTTVIDTLGINAANRATWVALAAEAGMPAYAVTFSTDPKLCRARNKQRARPVPAKALTAQITRFADVPAELAAEGYEVIAAADELRIINRSMAGTEEARRRQQASPQQLDFGLQISVFNFAGSPQATGERLVEIARAAEEVGFSSLWVMDHFMQIPQVGPEWWDIPEAYTTLSYLAAATRRIKLGTLATGVGYRNPALLGKMIATLDVLSGGRAMAGLGAGWFERETVGYGYPVVSTKGRLDRLEDVLQMLPLLWGPGSPSFEGKTFSVPEAICYPRPLQEHIPILVGGGGEKRTLRLVAQYADAANFFGGAANVRHKIEVLHEHCVAVGRDPAEIMITHLGPALVATDQSDLERRIAAIKPNNVSAAQFGAAVNAGTIDDQIGRFRTLAEAGVQAAILSVVGVVDASEIRRLAPIVDAFS